MNLQEIIRQLDDDPKYSANRQLAECIVRNIPQAVHYYLTVIGEPIMSYVENKIVHHNITSDYYLFLSNPYDNEEKKPKWHKVSLYKGQDCKLSSYTMCIAIRHFFKEAEKENKRRRNEGLLMEFVDYKSLLECDQIADDTDDAQMKCVRKAFHALSEKDQVILRCLVLRHMSALDAFPELSMYIKPRAVNGKTSEEVKKFWTKKQKQDAISLIKGRALEHLQRRFFELKGEYINR